MDFTLHGISKSKIPAVAFGSGTTYFHRSQDVTQGIIKAFKVGYRHIDTAIMYNTEDGVGQALKTLLESGHKREDIYVTTKVWPESYTYQKVMKAMEGSFERLGLDYIDLVLVHGPGMGPRGSKLWKDETQTFPESPEELKESRMVMWEALQDLKTQGKIRDIGVSNFNRFHLDQLITNPRCLEVPVLNQIEFNPYCVDQDILDYCQAKQILVQAYAPLGSGNRGQQSGKPSVLEDETLVKLAEELGCTVAQVCLAWALAKGVAVVTKTENEQRMKENLLATQVKLSSSQIQAIDKLNKNQRLFWNPYEIQ